MVTAKINVRNNSNQLIECRTLIDTCATSNFITEDFARRLGFQCQKCSIPISVLDGRTTLSRGLITTTISSRTTGYNRLVTFLIVPTISNFVPQEPIQRNMILIPKNIKLADPDFHKVAPVDMLLGTGIALSLLSIGQIDLSPKGGLELFLQKTKVGWVIGGSAPAVRPPRMRTCHLTAELQFDISKFWEIEEIPVTTSETETAGEEHFLKNTQRRKDGRYIVALPFNEKRLKLGESYSMAHKRLHNLQRKLSLNTELKTQYHNVLNEYIELGHLTTVDKTNANESGFYLPHHAVIKPGSLTTAVRVVFDGSAKSSTGISLNDTLMIGPTIQSELITLLLRFRKYPIVITGDIEKMYRQFFIRQGDRKYQRILWTNSRGEEQTYELNTVTFGLSCAPYLAIRCLHQLARDEQNKYPLASRVVQNDFYVDDLLTGANTVDEVVFLRNQLTQLLECGGLKIRQWASNDPRALKGLETESINKHLLLQDTTTIKTLGIKWDSSHDTIIYTVNPLHTPERITKRTIMSVIARIFDPLGLLAPIIITAKIIMQKLWTLKLDWDESLPIDIHTEWSQYHQQLPTLNNVTFERLIINENPVALELHGFCDASQKAYGACVYVRSLSKTAGSKITLLCAKSRVAPLKTTTIPRLELCGALLLTNLIIYVKEALQLKFRKIICWSDSTIVLHWLKTHPQNLKTFVANRIAAIQEKTEIHEWRHIRTQENPADLVSRGLPPAQFNQSELWTHGPSWLHLPEESWPQPLAISTNEELPEIRKVQCFKIATTNDDLLQKYSSLYKLQTVISYCMRLKRDNNNKGSITVAERRAALNIIIKIVQQTAFVEEIYCLTHKKPLNNKSRLLQLNPFIDDTGLIRVGGRLKHSFMPFTQRHPMIIPKSHHITDLIIEAEHRINLHSGVQATLYAIRRRYWILDGRNQVRKIIRSCITCCKLKPPTIDYLMGNLPASRVTPARPFSHVGIDYCGPFFIKEKKFRNRNKVKVYIAIFICLTIKAVHIEVVSDLSTDAFLAALKRFIARRGISTDIYTDNGTNFVGGRNEIKELYALLNDSKHQQKLSHYCNQREIKWHFIPARAPNFGGLWEAAVKSFKHHLRRTIGNTLLTFEELSTFVTEIEAILNSRPLTPISSDPNDLLVLTPAHFLIGDSLTSLPTQDFSNTPINRLSAWEHMQQMRQHFWSRWSREYLNELTTRHKWKKQLPNLQAGTVVLLKEDNLPPLQWSLGRITATYPGDDGIVRVVKIKTAKGEYERSVQKVAPLPIQLAEDETDRHRSIT